MFTGLVEEMGVIKFLKRGFASAGLTIGAQKVTEGMRVGDSVAVNGVCLTALSHKDSHFVVDVMAETLDRTNLGRLKPGDRVNLERALRLGDRLGGHLVSGHIDGIGLIRRCQRRDIAVLMTIDAPPEVMRYVIKKGSIAVDGVSLTVVDLDSRSFLVSLIPHSSAATTLGFKREGSTVNLEADMIGKYIEKLVTAKEVFSEKKDISLGFLGENGFL